MRATIKSNTVLDGYERDAGFRASETYALLGVLPSDNYPGGLVAIIENTEGDVLGIHPERLNIHESN